MVFASYKGQYIAIAVPLPSFLLYLKEQVGTDSSVKIIKGLNEDSEAFRRRFRKLQVKRVEISKKESETSSTNSHQKVK